MIWGILIDFIRSLGIFLYVLELVSKESQKVFGGNINILYRIRFTMNIVGCDIL